MLRITATVYNPAIGKTRRLCRSNNVEYILSRVGRYIDRIGADIVEESVVSGYHTTKYSHPITGVVGELIIQKINI